MTVVSLRGLHTALGVPAVTSGVVMVEYWAGSGPVARVDGADVVFPALITAPIVDGDPGTLDLVPTRGVCCAKWTVQSDRSAVSVVRFTEIPETGPVAFGALQQVDPATFVPTADVVAAWEAAIDDVAALRDQAAASAAAAAGSASTASTAATSAAGSAGAAAGSASAASGSASAAAGSASTASTGAATATSRATAASSSADAAAGSATAAAGSASAAAGSATAAAQSKTDADTARAAAQSAQTGAETARTGAEAARDIALAGQFAGAPLNSADLNTILTPGIYRQATAGNATLALNYPKDGAVGVLEVLPTFSNTAILQRYTIHNTAQTAMGAYQRRYLNGVWTSWRFIPTMRIDESAGRSVFLYDELNSRDQRIQADTGWRSITADLINGWTCTGARLRRIGSDVILRLQQLNSSAATAPTIYSLPAGFRTGDWLVWTFASKLGQAPLYLETQGASGFDLRAYGGALPSPAWVNVPDGGRYFEVRFLTTDAWPTVLPGTASGTIPN